MNIIDEFDHVTTFDYTEGRYENTATDEINNVSQWLDDFGWV